MKTYEERVKEMTQPELDKEYNRVVLFNKTNTVFTHEVLLERIEQLKILKNKIMEDE